MFATLIVIHVIVACSLVFIVLLQSGKGAELGAAFGGTGQATYGPGQSTFITKFTTTLAVIFMTTSLSLAFLSTDQPKTSVMGGSVVAPIQEEQSKQKVDAAKSEKKAPAAEEPKLTPEAAPPQN